MKTLLTILIWGLLYVSAGARDATISHTDYTDASTFEGRTDVVYSEPFWRTIYSYYRVSAEIVTDSTCPQPTFDSLIVFLEFSKDSTHWNRMSSPIHRLPFRATNGMIRAKQEIYPNETWSEWARIACVCKNRVPHRGTAAEICHYTYRVRIEGMNP